MNIEKKLIRYNYSARSGRVEYIVIHQTGNVSKSAGVDNHFNYFNACDRNSSADYFVDDKKIGQFVDAPNKSWHCGDGAGKYGITNNNSVGVEICINSDGNYLKTIDNAVWLVKHLMSKYNLGIDKVVRHYDASRKQCPAQILAGKDGITWDKFKEMIKTNSNTNSTSSFLVKIINTDSLNVRKGPGTNYSITTTVKRNEVYTIVAQDGTWGKLKSGAGWISLNYTTRV